MSKKLTNPKKVTNILTVTTKFYTKNGWPWCRTRVYANGWYCGVTDKYSGSGRDVNSIIQILEKSGHLQPGLNREGYSAWLVEYNIYTENDDITVGRLYDL